MANFLKGKKKDYFKTSESKYDVCMISDALIIDVDKHFGTENVEQDMGDFAKYIIKYCTNKNKKFICSFKRVNSSPESLNGELKYYRKHLSDTEYNFLIPGIYAYWCTPHKAMGMIGFVIVGNDLTNLDSVKSIKYLGKSKKIAKILLAQIS